MGEPRPSRARELLRQVPRRSYALTRWRLLRRMARASGDPVVVFCMSKTASSAVVRAVRDAVPRPVHKVHLLGRESVARAEAEYRRTAPAMRPRHVLHAAHLLRHPPTPAHPWLVITIVREPIGRSASDLFQSGERRGLLDAADDADVTAARFSRFALEQGIPRTLDWFDRELAPALGIDVYAHPFDPTVGHTTIETASVRLLVLRQESLAVAPAALGRFLGLDADLELAPENVGADKAYSERYAEVIRAARLPVEALDLAYESRFARHFYSDAERAALRERWGGPVG